MRSLIIFLIIAVFAFSSDIDKKIQNTSYKLKSYSQNYKILNQKMAKIATSIIKQKKIISSQEKQIKTLEKELKEKASSYEISKKQLKKLLKKKEKLKKIPIV
jgi:septal ring factor EnvC (AmiA/AmiB activator)